MTATLKNHSWAITHFIEQAKGCADRTVDGGRLKAMPHLKGTCHICLHYKPVAHIHNDSPICNVMKHQHCTNYKGRKVGCITGNKEEIALALAKPHQIIWTGRT